MRRKYTNEEVKEAVQNSTSIRQVLLRLNLAPQGGSYTTIHNLIKNLNLDTTHFKGQGWNKGSSQPQKEIEIYLSNQYPIKSHKLRLRLIREKILTKECSSCHLNTWLNQPIPLELDHIDGNHSNNTLNNLRLICPNCHAQTPTYRGKNIGRSDGSRTHKCHAF